MDNLFHTADELRRMTESELVELGHDSLKTRLKEQGEAARLKHGVLSPGNLETILTDPDCLRYPTRLVLEFGEMGMHQFAQPDLDLRDETGQGRVLYLRPILGKRPDLLALAVSYMIPVINYGEMVRDDHCQIYGAAIMNMDPDIYFQAICELADYVGAETRMTDERDDMPDIPGSSGCGCGGGGCGS